MILSHRLARLALPLALLALLLLAMVSLAVGDMRLGWEQIWNGLRGTDEMAATIVRQIRLPRIFVGIAVGAGLASSGVVMQAYFRNSLASPGLLGVSSGGAAGAVIAIAAGGAGASLWFVPAAAIVGAFGATAAVLMLAQRGATTERLLLAGVALNALLGAVTSFVLSSFTGRFELNTQIIFWLLGGLEDRTWEHVLVAALIFPAALWLWPLGRSMDLLSLGEAEAQSLGVDVRRLRRTLLALATVLAAVATAVAGTIGFVGLVVPHLLRMLVGPEHRRLVPLAIVGGATFVLACDLVSRTAGELRLGIVTSLLGGPFFLWLLRRHR